jgi:hypothetical protein
LQREDLALGDCQPHQVNREAIRNREPELGSTGVVAGNPSSGFFNNKMPVKVKNNIRWSMSFAPVMACQKLEIEEKVLLNAIMSMKNSFDNVYATPEKIGELTGLYGTKYETALAGLQDKELVVRTGNQWRIRCVEINKFLGVEVYDIAKLNGKK